jgi:hypothetical protein
MRCDHLDLVAAVTQAARPHGAYDPDTGRLGVIVVAPELDAKTLFVRDTHRADGKSKSCAPGLTQSGTG